MEPYVWRYDMAEHRWQRRAPKKVARKRYYYAYRNKNGQLVNKIEPYLSAIESSGAKLIRTLAAQTLLTKRERQDLSLFIAQLAVRTPQNRTGIELFLKYKGEESGTALVQHWREHPDEFALVLCKYRDKTGKMSDISIDDVERSAPKLVPTDAGLLEALLLSMLGLGTRLLTMTWRIFFTQTEHRLIICDHPYELGWSDEITEETFRGFWTKDIEFHVPLTPNMLFAAFDYGPSCILGGFLGSELVVQLNQRMAERAEEFIISPTSSFLGDDVLARCGRQT